jgi:DNA-binding NarL/FixJ family response regulator
MTAPTSDTEPGPGAPQPPFRVVLVEDSALLAARIADVIRGLAGVELVAAVASETAAVDTLSRGDADGVVLDLNLVQGNGFGVMRSIRKLGLPVEVIVFTSYDIPAYRRAASALGAAEFLHKTRDHDKLPDAIRRLAAARLAGACAGG